MKYLTILFLVLTISQQSFSGDLSVTWYGTTNVKISDGETSLVFDPFFNRPTIWQILTKKYASTEDGIKNWLNSTELKTVKAIFTSHTHYDHAFDLGQLSKLTPAKVYGSSSTNQILRGTGSNQSIFKLIKVGEEIKINEFVVTVLPGSHPPHFLSFTLLSGPIKNKLNSKPSIFDYKLGDQYNFYISHPKGSILFHPSSNPQNFRYSHMSGKVDLLLQGVASRKSSLNIIQKIILPVKAKKVIPLHFDNFFKPMDEKLTHFPTVKLNEFSQSLKNNLKDVEYKIPSYGQKNPVDILQ